MKTGEIRYFHDQLPKDTHRRIYEALEEAMAKRAPIMRLKVEGDVPSIEQLREITMHVYNDHPEFFDLFTSKILYSVAWHTVRIRLTYRHSDKIAKMHMEALQTAVDRFIADCFPEGWRQLSEIRREKMIFDQLTSQVVYDFDALGKSDLPDVHAWSAYGALVQKKAVCHGISCAFKLLCDQVDIPCIVVLGDASGRHAWNLVRIQYRFAHVDCTWLLRSSIDMTIPYARDRYFNVPDWVIKRTRTVDVPYLPKCTSLRFNPFHMRGLCASTCEELCRVLKDQLLHGQKRLAAMLVHYPVANEELNVLVQGLCAANGISMRWYLDDTRTFFGAICV